MTYKCAKCNRELKIYETNILIVAKSKGKDRFDLCDECYEKLKDWLK